MKFPPLFPDGYPLVDAEYDAEEDALVTTREDGRQSPPVAVKAALTANLRTRQIAAHWFLV